MPTTRRNDTDPELVPGGADHAAMRGPLRRLGRGAALAVVAVAYLCATVIAVAVGAGVVATTPDASPLVVVLAADLAGTVVIFAWSIALRNSSMYDAYWSVAPPVIAVWYVLLPAATDVPVARTVLVVAGVWFWAVRLTANWARGWPGFGHEDWRYVDLRRRIDPRGGPRYWSLSFTGLHLFPTVVVYLGCLGLYPALVVGRRPFGALDVLAAVVVVGAVVVEFVADEQLRRFVRSGTGGRVMADGLWRWSRHPNYFGECTFWWGIWLFGVAAAPSWWWTVVGPVAMTAMFLGVSIPMMEKRSLAKRPDYAAHVAATSALVPLPRRLTPHP
jgi:steroid 5-alpha reductase family enzyme